MNSNYNKNPGIRIQDIPIWSGWDQIINEINSALHQIEKPKKVLILETYAGVHDTEILDAVEELDITILITSTKTFKTEPEIRQITQNYVTDDRIDRKSVV